MPKDIITAVEKSDGEKIKTVSTQKLLVKIHRVL